RPATGRRKPNMPCGFAVESRPVHSTSARSIPSMHRKEIPVKLVAGSIRNPLGIAVAVLLVCLFGWLSLRQLPLQLFPDIERPTISILTNWRGASPEEVESE